MCDDPLMKFMAKYNYQAVKVPDSMLAPGQLAIKESKRQVCFYDELGNYFKSSSKEAPKSVESSVPEFRGMCSDKIDIEVGIPILANILHAVPIPIGTLRDLYKRAKYLRLTLADCKKRTVSMGAIDRYLKGATPRSLGKTAQEAAEKGNLYVITEVLLSNNILIRTFDHEDREIPVEMGALKEEWKASLKLGTNEGGYNTLTYNADKPLGFGFQAMRLNFEDGRFSGLGFVNPGNLVKSVNSMHEGDDAPTAGEFEWQSDSEFCENTRRHEI